jgi:hypothetical protein
VNVNKWVVLGAAVLTVVGASALAASSNFYTFGSAAYTVVVSQANPQGPPQYSYSAWWGSDLVALALGTAPTDNQVLAIAMNCDSTAAILVVYDTSNSSIMRTIAQTTTLDKVQQADPVTGITNQERFVAVFDVQPTGNLAGGYLTMAGRVHLDSNGCATTVLASRDRDPLDKAVGDRDIARLTRGRNTSSQRSGQAHFMGVLDIISGGQTNTVLVPSGHLTSCNQLD